MNTANNFRGEFEVTIRGKKVKGAFTMNALRLAMKNEGVKLEEIDKYLEADPLTAVPTLGYYGAISEAVKTGKDLKVSKELFIAEVLDNGYMEAVTEAITGALGADEQGAEEGND